MWFFCRVTPSRSASRYTMVSVCCVRVAEITSAVLNCCLLDVLGAWCHACRCLTVLCAVQCDGVFGLSASIPLFWAGVYIVSLLLSPSCYRCRFCVKVYFWSILLGFGVHCSHASWRRGIDWFGIVSNCSFVALWRSMSCDRDTCFIFETLLNCRVVMMDSRFCASVAVFMHFLEESLQFGWPRRTIVAVRMYCYTVGWLIVELCGFRVRRLCSSLSVMNLYRVLCLRVLSFGPRGT